MKRKSIKINEEIHKKLKVEASKKGISIKQLLEKLIKKELWR